MDGWMDKNLGLQTWFSCHFLYKHSVKWAEFVCAFDYTRNALSHKNTTPSVNVGLFRSNISFHKAPFCLWKEKGRKGHSHWLGLGEKEPYVDSFIIFLIFWESYFFHPLQACPCHYPRGSHPQEIGVSQWTKQKRFLHLWVYFLVGMTVNIIHQMYIYL